MRHRLGVLRLLRLSGGQQSTYLRKQLLRGNEFNLVLAAAKLDRAALAEDLIDAAYMQAMCLDEELPLSEEGFNAIMAKGKGELVTRANEMEAVLLNFLRVFADVRRQLSVLEAGKWLDTRQDIEQQVQHLLPASFQRDTPQDWLAQFPRYAKALRTRLERLAGQYAKDQQHTAMLQDDRPGVLLLCAEARQYRWMLEELRVSLFAQSLGTRQAVSKKRLQEQWQSVSQWLDKNPH